MTGLPGLRRNKPNAFKGAVFLALSIVLAVAVAACGGGGSSSGGSTGGGGGGGEEEGGGGEHLKIAWIYSGPKQDGGWSEAISRGEEAVEEKFGSKVENLDAESVPYSDQVTQVAEQFIAQGANIIMDTNGYGELFTKACEAHPEVTCIQVSPQGQLPENTLGWSPQFWSSEYIAGMAAGLATESNTVGYVMPYEVPLAKGPMNSFAMGCLASNPSCNTRFVVTNDYYNPPKENQAANTLIDAGADVIRAWLNDQAFCTTAEGRGVRAVGEFTDLSTKCPKSAVTTLTMNFAPFFTEQVEAVFNGTFKQENLHILPVKGVIELGEWGPGISTADKQKVETALEELGNGKLYPWTGPISDQEGQVKIPSGKKLTEKFIYNEWEWLVEGIQ